MLQYIEQFIRANPVVAGAIIALVGTILSQLVLFYKNFSDIKNNRANIIKEFVIERQFEKGISYFSDTYQIISNSEVDRIENFIMELDKSLDMTFLRLDAIYKRQWTKAYHEASITIRNMRNGETVSRQMRSKIFTVLREIIWFEQRQIRNLNSTPLRLILWRIIAIFKFNL